MAMAYFSCKGRRYRLWACLESWVGTPYRHWCGVKKQGADCIHFIARVLEEIEYAKKPYTIPWYNKDWHIHNSIELLFSGIKKQVHAREVDVDCPRDGDIILFKYGHTLSHSGFYYDGHIYHAITNIGVTKSSWQDDMWYKRRRKALRLF